MPTEIPQSHMDIRSLGYVGIGAPDPRVWLEYATDIIGLMPARACAGEALPGLVLARPGECRLYRAVGRPARARAWLAMAVST
jgi:hypothetical protein